MEQQQQQQPPPPQPSPQPLFGLVPAGQPLITSPSSQPTPTSFLYAIPPSKPFAHLTVFLLPDVALPPGAAAAIYLAPNAAAGAEFQFLGGIGPGKESAVFRLSSAGAEGGVVIGVSVEDGASVAERMMQHQQQQHHPDPAPTTNNNTSTSLVPMNQTQTQTQAMSTQVLAQRIIQNAFNFLAGFSGKVGAEGVEVVPLRAFQDWWRKFENKVRNDPTFLERGQD
ncbi:uncharacterized protein GGS25DRAFT_471426 [Hypoxylon fragiforme]|uniref:uncharacterized protein n=1 Tax=Hypoxylon fragiforme TaxID=63214 RepID=UPI0020C66C80|nr:uncharacterized protein GGS25DRAFT_471426 [Hypoxylon fragiforme]KAI2614378.1 hypothetical protein GGS25DRAFT_471426 [Hypoxylon fragiforme]